jgi:hypothetical protein
MTALGGLSGGGRKQQLMANRHELRRYTPPVLCRVVSFPLTRDSDRRLPLPKGYGLVVERAWKMIVWVSGRHPSLSLLVQARSTIALMPPSPAAQGDGVVAGGERHRRLGRCAQRTRKNKANGSSSIIEGP